MIAFFYTVVRSKIMENLRFDLTRNDGKFKIMHALINSPVESCVAYEQIIHAAVIAVAARKINMLFEYYNMIDE